MKYNLVVCGGTFDHLHKGHKEFLKHILNISNRVVIGLTTDSYIKAKNASELIEDYKVRKIQLENFFDEEKASSRVEIEPIDDVFIPKIWENLPIEAIVVSKDTVLGAEKINLKRKEQGKSPLKIEIVSLVEDQNNEYISSSRIRQGEIDREGKPYLNPLWLKKDLFLPENLREEFKKPFGELFKDIDDSFKNHNSLVITVGDVTAKIFNEKSLGQNISVIDFKVAREKKFANILELGFAGDENIFTADNPAGHITSDLFKKISEIMKSNMQGKIIMQINGEEDLAVLPLILLSPLGTFIYYGQPSEGVVRIEVLEEIKKIAYRLVNKLEMLK